MRFVPRLVATVGLLAMACARDAAPPSAPTGGERISGTAGSPNDVTHIDCGDFHACAALRDGTARCWGRDREGELGDGDRSDADQKRPVVVVGLAGVEELALGATFSCARLRDKTVTCWGSGKILGDGREVSKIAPTAVVGLRDVVELRAGGYVACARTAAGAARCWGLAAAEEGVPTADVEALSVGAAHACARMKDGSARCWGEGAWGGHKERSFSTPKIRGVTGIATGDSFACALLDEGKATCWGRNDQGELGSTSDQEDHATPLPVGGLVGAVELAAAESHVCARLTDASVRCWGSNTEGELGRGTRSAEERPGAVQGLDHVSDIALGADYGCATTVDGALYCWGNNHDGQIGDGTNESRFTPVRITW